MQSQPFARRYATTFALIVFFLFCALFLLAYDRHETAARLPNSHAQAVDGVRHEVWRWLFFCSLIPVSFFRPTEATQYQTLFGIFFSQIQFTVFYPGEQGATGVVKGFSPANLGMIGRVIKHKGKDFFVLIMIKVGKCLALLCNVCVHGVCSKLGYDIYARNGGCWCKAQRR